MKVIFFSLSVIGFVYLALQTSSGQLWLSKLDGYWQSSSKTVLLAQQKEELSTQNDAENQLSKLLEINKQLTARVEKLELAIANTNFVDRGQINSNATNSEQVDKNQINLHEKGVLPVEQNVVIANESVKDARAQVALNTGAQSASGSQVREPIKINNSAAKQREIRSQQQIKLQEVINKMELASLTLINQ